MKHEMNDQIFDKYPVLIQEAIEAAPKQPKAGALTAVKAVCSGQHTKL